MCDEPETMQIDTVDNKGVTGEDTLCKISVVEQPAIPENMITYFAFDKSDFIIDPSTDKFM